MGKASRRKQTTEKRPATAEVTLSLPSQAPWYESNRVWGSFGTSLSLILAVVAGMRIWLLCPAWLLFLVGIRAIIYETVSQVKYRKVYFILGTFLSGALFYGLYIQYATQPFAEVAKEPFGVEVRTAFVSDSGPLTSHMVVYRSPLGLTASPVFYLMFVRITNLQEIASTIRDFKVAVSEKKEGPWEDLVSIQLALSSLYYLGVRPESPGNPQDTPTMIMGPGTIRLLGAVTIEDMRYAIPLRPDRTLDSEFTKPIQPHSPISGWVALDSRRYIGVVTKEIYFHITLRDTAGKGSRYVVPMPVRGEGGGSMYVDTGMFRIDGLMTDISSSHVKYYGDPFPSHR